MTDFGRKLKETLVAKGVTYEALAEKALISKTSVCMYIHYDVLPTADNLKAICEALEVSADYLLGLGKHDE